MIQTHTVNLGLNRRALTVLIRRVLFGILTSSFLPLILFLAVYSETSTVSPMRVRPTRSMDSPVSNKQPVLPLVLKRGASVPYRILCRGTLIPTLSGSPEVLESRASFVDLRLSHAAYVILQNKTNQILSLVLAVDPNVSTPFPVLQPRQESVATLEKAAYTLFQKGVGFRHSFHIKTQHRRLVGVSHKRHYPLQWLTVSFPDGKAEPDLITRLHWAGSQDQSPFLGEENSMVVFLMSGAPHWVQDHGTDETPCPDFRPQFIQLEKEQRFLIRHTGLARGLKRHPESAGLRVLASNLKELLTPLPRPSCDPFGSVSR